MNASIITFIMHAASTIIKAPSQTIGHWLPEAVDPLLSKGFPGLPQALILDNYRKLQIIFKDN